MTLLALLWASLSVAGAAREPSYVGAARCRLCHRDVYQSWKRTAHARATASIPEGQDRCLACHATSGRDLEGVQCEACHGAGSDYWPGEVMMDPEKAVMAGLRKPGEAVCRRCHASAEPGHRPDFAIPPPGELARVVHEMPAP